MERSEERKIDKNETLAKTTEPSLQMAQTTALLEEIAFAIPVVIEKIFEVVKFTPDLVRFKEAKPYWEKVVTQMTDVLVQSQQNYHALGKFLMSNNMICENIESFEKGFQASKAKIEDRLNLYFPKVENSIEIAKTFSGLLSKLSTGGLDNVQKNFLGFLQCVSGEVLLATEVKKRQIQDDIKTEFNSIEKLNMDQEFIDLSNSVAKKEGSFQSLSLKKKGIAESIALIQTRMDRKIQELKDLEKTLSNQSKDAQYLLDELSKKVESGIQELEKKKRNELDSSHSAHKSRVEKLSDSKQSALAALEKGSRVDKKTEGWWIFSWTSEKITQYDNTQGLNEKIQSLEHARSAEMDFVKQEEGQITRKYDQEIDNFRKRAFELNRMRNEGIQSILDSQKKEIEHQLEGAKKDLKGRQDEEVAVAINLQTVAVELDTEKGRLEVRRAHLNRIRAESNFKIKEAQQKLVKLKTSLDTNLKTIGSPSIEHAYYLLARILDLNKTTQDNVQTLVDASNFAETYLIALKKNCNGGQRILETENYEWGKQ